MTTIQSEALQRAQSGQSIRNAMIVESALRARGIAADDIRPRENVLTFHAWRALGRTVRKGEKGIQLITWIPVRKRDAVTGETKIAGSKPKNAYVFHVSQTDPYTGAR